MKQYDYLVVGAGLFGAVFAREAKQKGKKVLVIDKRNHIAGNSYTKNENGINVHKYGAHIFHTNDYKVWEYVNKFAEFNNFKNSPLANFDGQLYSMPFNMYTFNKMFGVNTPLMAKRIIDEQRKEIKGSPKNLEEQAISLVGRDIYEKLIKGYTEKQWGKECKDLPAFIIKRLPVRFTYDNNYFNSIFQGIPIGGYTLMIEKMLAGITTLLETDYLKDERYFNSLADKIIYTGAIDEYFHYALGELEYRSLMFEEETIDIDNFQGNAVVNYTSKNVPFTRIIEHKWFEGVESDTTIISKEYPVKWKEGTERYYPVNDKRNNELYDKYKKLAKEEENVIFAGRLGEYKYYDMDEVVSKALELSYKI